MDSSKKPDQQNPRSNSNPLSQLFFLWVIPTLWHGCRNDLTIDDRTKCLEIDESGRLGDKLELAWKNELTKAKEKNRKPKLKNAIFKTFRRYFIIDGFLMFTYILCKTLLPIVFAQLLIQFPELPSSTSIQINTTSLQNNNNNFRLNTSTNHVKRSIDENIDHEISSEKFKMHFLNIENKFKTGSTKNRREIALDGAENRDQIILDDTTKVVNKTNPFNSLFSSEESLNDRTLNCLFFIWHSKIGLAIILILLIFIGFLAMHHGELRQRLLGARMRIACCSLIYRKTLNLSHKSASETAAGYLVNLLSNDVIRLDYGFMYIHYIWIMPLQVAIVVYLIWIEIGWPSIVAVIILLLQTIPIQTLLSRWLSSLRLRIAKRTDHRIEIMDELIQGIQVIKMYAWEKSFQYVVSQARHWEIKLIRYASYIRGINTSAMVISERSTLFFVILICTLTERVLSAAKIFSMAQFFNALQLTTAIYYPLALAFSAEAFISIKRIEEMLLMEEKGDEKTKPLALELNGTTSSKTHKDDDNSIEDHEEKQNLLSASPISTKKSTPENLENAIEMINITASWDQESAAKKTLNKINLNIKNKSLFGIIGPVGAGKSSILNLILGELPIEQGYLNKNPDISYASQEPWLFTGTVRNNILFGLPYDKERYQQVVQCCALTRDFKQLAYGDKTVVGERGTSLSGGQRARISLARAVYKKAAIYLLDDPLSAVDAHVGKQLFNEVIGPSGLLATWNSTRILITHQVHFLKVADQIVILDDGRILCQGTYDELANDKTGDFSSLLNNISSIENAKENDGSEVKFKAVSKEQLNSKYTSSLTSLLYSSKENFYEQENDEEQEHGGITWSIFEKYFTAGGTICSLTALVFVIIISQGFTSMTDYFVRFVSIQEDMMLNNEPTQFNIETTLYIYGGLIVGVSLIVFLRTYLFYYICMLTSEALHNKMFRSILSAPMRFFDTNSSGRILNRFSKDLGAIDEILPRSMLETLQIGLVMIGILILVGIINPIMIAVMAVAFILYCLVLKLYLHPSQDLKRLEGISRSPVFSHIAGTMTGLSTIRSRGLEKRLVHEFDELQDVHSSVWQVTTSAAEACGLWLDIISILFIIAVIFSFIIRTDAVAGSSVGLALSQALILTGMVQYGVRQMTESLQQMTNVERILQYTNLEQEPNPNKIPSKNWPDKGCIEFKNMSLRYAEDAACVLKNITLEIQPTWKVGIIGRTGAGKSSLIGAIFRLNLIDGEILIDNVETGTISLESLRSKISIIPQNPVLFCETIRYNLDPFQAFNDDALWRALEDVELKSSIESLDYKVIESGANFSIGQRQLICLARAILRNNKILVLDEATANVDPQTDALIQRTIRVKFKNCTVLTVAHRLHTVMDSDRILVMDAGRVKEFDIPHLLLQNENGLLFDMVNATGPSDAKLLKNIAHKTYINK